MADVIATVTPVTVSPAAPDGTAAPTPAITRPAEPEPTDDYEIDGKKVTLTRTQAKTYIQKAAAVDKRLQSVAEKEKKLDAMLADFEKDPEAVLAKAGKDPAKALEAFLTKKAAQGLMTQEQKERAALEAERDELKAKQKAVEDEKRTKAEQEIDRRNFEAIEQQLVAAADRSGVDGTPEALEMMCEVAIEALDLGLNLTPDQIAQEVIRRQKEHVEARDKKLLSKLEGKKLLEYLGPDLVKRIQAATLAGIPAPAVKPRAKPTALPPRSEAGKFVSENDFNRKFGLR